MKINFLDVTMTKAEKKEIYDHMEQICSNFAVSIEKIKSTLEGDELYGKEPNTLVVQITLKKERKEPALSQSL